MCNCKQKIDWQVLAIEDDECMANGYDGDLDDGESTEGWQAFCIIVQKVCTRCDATETHDSMGSIWVLPHQDAYSVLTEMVLGYGMVPKNVRDWVISD